MGFLRKLFGLDDEPAAEPASFEPISDYTFGGISFFPDKVTGRKNSLFYDFKNGMQMVEIDLSGAFPRGEQEVGMLTSAYDGMTTALAGIGHTTVGQHAVPVTVIIRGGGTKLVTVNSPEPVSTVWAKGFMVLKHK